MSRLSRLSRSSRRGAALVEAAVVLPVLVALLGIGMMLSRAYSEKLDANQSIRATSLDYASHDCERRGIPSSGRTATMEGLALPVRGMNGGAAQEIARELEKTTPALSGKSGRARAEYAEKVIDNPKPSTSTGGFGWKLTLHGERSETVCNDRPREGSLAGMAGFVKEQVGR